MTRLNNVLYTQHNYFVRGPVVRSTRVSGFFLLADLKWCVHSIDRDFRQQVGVANSGFGAHQRDRKYPLNSTWASLLFSTSTNEFITKCDSLVSRLVLVPWWLSRAVQWNYDQRRIITRNSRKLNHLAA